MRQWTNRRLVVGLIAGAAGIVGCAESADPKFAADTYDEYTEPLADAVIGTPAGTTVVGPAGETTFVPAALAGPAVGVTAGGRSGATGGSTGAGGRPSTGGGTGTAGAPGKGGAMGAGGMTGAAGSAGTGGDRGTAGGSGFWHFDDCSPTSHFLLDSSGFGANAQQALNAACVAGISGQGVQIRSAKDIIQVPDEPQFTVTDRVAVAAWVNPNTVSGNQPIVIKRLNNQTSFSLGVHNGNIEMSVVLSTGKTIISSAPISAGVWTHVAGMYDGTFVFLFIDGQQFGQVFGGQALRNVFAPLRIGATTQSQHFDGIIDEVFVSTGDISKDALTALSCVGRPSTMTVTPVASDPTPPDTIAPFTVSVTDNDVGACQPRQYQAFFSSFESGIATSFLGPPFQNASAGQTITFAGQASGTPDADPGPHAIAFTVFDFQPQTDAAEQLPGQFTFNLQAPSGCFVSTRKELMITSTSVVDDPVRTVADGAWSFGHVLRQVAPSAEQAPALALQLFQHWLTDQTVNQFNVAARPKMQQQILNAWPKTPSGDLDLDRAPFALQAIVNRFDLRDAANGSAGQARLVYAFTDPTFRVGEDFTVILEFELPAADGQAIADWANRWHALASHPFPSEEYNVALEAITRSFTERNAASARVNGSDLLQLRTNDLLLSPDGRWELREFQLSASTGFFDEVTVKETPDLSFNGTQTFADFVNQKAADIIAVVPGAPSHTVSDQFEGVPFQAGSSLNDGFTLWNGPGIQDAEARFHASLNTCNGCHGLETGTKFLMVSPRSVGSESALSPFLTGTTVFDPFTGQPRSLNDLDRRKTDLTGVVCAPPPAPIAVN